jgi:Ca-activated chloride channel family protein
MKVQAQPDQSQQDDPEFRRLEAVESARDPSFLIRAQMQLQAQQKQRPQQSQKEW